MNKPKEIPMLFSTDMVKAILGGIKKETRRKIKPQPNPEYFKVAGDFPQRQISCNAEDAQHTFLRSPKTGTAVFIADAKKIYNKSGCPYGKPGDLVWVRETWQEAKCFEFNMEGLVYRADENSADFASEYNVRWKPSIYLPKSGSRIWLMVEEIKVERLNDITEQSAINEGCPLYGPFGEYRGSKHPNGGSMKYRAYSKAVNAFECIWESINGEKSWKKNPWVWVVKFKVLSITGRPSDSEIRENYLKSSKEIQP